MRPASLKLHFQLWLGGGALACLALAAGIRWLQLQSALAGAQDARLLDRVAHASAAAPQALPPYPWPQELQPGAAPSLYYANVQGNIVRAAAAARGDGTIVQAAEPLSRRWPSASELWDGPLAGLVAGMLAMGTLAAIAVWRAGRWSAEALAGWQALDAAARPAPDEFRPVLQRLRELHDGEREWVAQQRRFLADAAHQLRTPVTVLRTQVQAALEMPGDPRPALAAMLQTVDRTAALANQLLSLSRIEQLKRTGELKAIGVAAVVRDAIVELAPLISRKRLEFALEGEGFDAPADPVLLGELVRNLLANAIHHSPEGGPLGIVLRPGLGGGDIVVWDEGPGIADEVRPRLFTPFAGSKGGVGLGLSICRQIGEAMGAGVSLFDRVAGGRAIGVDAVVAWKPRA